ncbi:putative SLACS reverse transcriptase [Trypanosoma cruzi]|uniref:Putative SLACS reverse transcriptase n=1 Tax=Trypanosoma cruzi TaxID=5693 RepID=A0A2V2VVC6_TRYCR|nr:putative SLACS reverse transcriptase [Trypanosoma cruzi]
MEITAILTDMANGNVAPEVAHRLRATNLTVLRKPNKKFRPIGAECVWAKAISLMAVDAVMPALKTCFKNLQYGVGNNIELAIEKVRQDFHIKGSVAMLDGRNAYNAISRTAILSAVYGNTTWSPLWRVTRLLLGTEGLVGFYEKGQLVHSWTSTRECDRAWCWDRCFFPSAPSPPSANWKAASPTPASRRTWTTLRWRHHRACLGRYARRHPESDACPGHRDERGQDGGPPYRRTSGHARGVHPAVCPRARRE